VRDQESGIACDQQAVHGIACAWIYKSLFARMGFDEADLVPVYSGQQRQLVDHVAFENRLRGDGAVEFTCRAL
jgi:hypothetical protein